STRDWSSDVCSSDLIVGRITCLTVADFRLVLAKITKARGCKTRAENVRGRNRQQVADAGRFPRALVIAEDKQLVLLNGSAKRGPKRVPFGGREEPLRHRIPFGIRERITRLGCVCV